MTDHQAFLLTRGGTVAICFGGFWILIGGLAYLVRIFAGVTNPGAGSVARARRRPQSLLGEPELATPTALRALRATAQYFRFRVWMRWAFRIPLIVLAAGELLHLGGNYARLHLHEEMPTWRVVSNWIGLGGSLVLCVFIARLLLAASPRLLIIRDVLAAGERLKEVTEDQRGDHADRVLRQFARLERRITSFYTLSHPAGDPYTRSRLVNVANGLYGLFVDAKHDLLFADALTLISTRQALWLTAAAAAADPVALTEAERAAVGSGRTAEQPRPRLVYRAATVLAIVAVGGAVIGLWYVDHSALSVVFSAVAAPLLVPAVVGLARRGWNRNETEGMAEFASGAKALMATQTEAPGVEVG
jgi:hypothetical protein